MPKSTVSAEAAGSMSGEVLIFLFTDIEGSTLRWELAPEAMRTALARHDALVRSAITEAGGRVFKSVGDAFCAVFRDPTNALSAALSAQRSIDLDGFAEVGGLKVRMAVDAGAVETREGDYFGRTARLLAAGHGGQILVAEAAAELVGDGLPANSTLTAPGSHYLKDFAEPQEIYQLATTDIASAFPSLRTLSTTRGNLPQRLTSFIGREAEIEENGSMWWWSIRSTGSRDLCSTSPRSLRCSVQQAVCFQLIVVDLRHQSGSTSRPHALAAKPRPATNRKRAERPNGGHMPGELPQSLVRRVGGFPHKRVLLCSHVKILYGPSLAKGLAMSDSRTMTGDLSSDELALIDRVLRRANNRLLLNQVDKQDETTLAINLYRCGFANEDQLLDQLLQALRPRHRR